MANKVDYAALKKGGFMRQKQKGYGSLRLAVVGGNLTAENIRTVSEVAEKYGKGYVHMTSRQGIEIPFIKVEDLDKYISLLTTCKTASEVGEVVATMCENEPNIDSDRIAKESFIRLLLPFIPHVEKGKGIDNLRIQIDKAWTARKKALRNQK